LHGDDRVRTVLVDELVQPLLAASARRDERNTLTPEGQVGK